MRIIETETLTIVAKLADTVRPTVYERLSKTCLANIVYPVDQEEVNDAMPISTHLERIAKVFKDVGVTDANSLTVSWTHYALKNVLLKECEYKSLAVPIQLQKWITTRDLLDRIFPERKSLSSALKSLRLPKAVKRIDNQIEFLKYFVNTKVDPQDGLQETGWAEQYRPTSGHIYVPKNVATFSNLFG